MWSHTDVSLDTFYVEKSSGVAIATTPGVVPTLFVLQEVKDLV